VASAWAQGLLVVVGFVLIHCLNSLLLLVVLLDCRRETHNDTCSSPGKIVVDQVLMVVLKAKNSQGLDKGIGNLALFIVPRSNFPDSPQHADAIHIRRLKSKLGLRSVPSGEVEFRDAVAWPCGDPLDGKGINRVMEVVSPFQRNGVAAMV
jgi:hypothetical protein